MASLPCHISILPRLCPKESVGVVPGRAHKDQPAQRDPGAGGRRALGGGAQRGGRAQVCAQGNTCGIPSAAWYKS